MKAYVYFARRADGVGPIKIGTSRNVRGRLYQLQFKVGHPIAAIAIMPTEFCGHALESRFHAYFESVHVGHEWFEPTPELLDVAERICRGTFDATILPKVGWCVTKPYRTKSSIKAALPETPGRIAA